MLVIKNLYSLKFQKCIKVLSIFAITLLAISNSTKIYSLFILKDTEYFLLSLTYLILNSISIVLCIFLFFNPVKFELIAILAFLYSFISLYYEIENPIGILMYLMGLSIFIYRGFFKKHKTIKAVISGIIFLSLFFSEIRFGVQYFIETAVYKAGLIFLILCLFVFLAFIISEPDSKEKTLNLANYPNLTFRDSIWLKDILNKKTYKEIAYENNMIVGSVKNRLKIIYDALEVGDKQGFLNKYSGFQICYGEELSSINHP